LLPENFLKLLVCVLLAAFLAGCLPIGIRGSSLFVDPALLLRR